MGPVADATRASGVDSARFVTTIRPSRTGLGLRHHAFCGPSFSLLCADLPPQPPADVRSCRDRLRLCLRRIAWGVTRIGRRSRGSRPACAHAARSEARGSDTDHRRARGGHRRQRGRRAVSVGRRFARRRLRLLRARLLGVRPVGHRAPAQLLRALCSGSAGSTFQNEGRRPTLLFRARARRHLHRPRSHGARAALRQPGRGRQAGPLELWEPARRRPARRPHLNRVRRIGAWRSMRYVRPASSTWR